LPSRFEKKKIHPSFNFIRSGIHKDKDTIRVQDADVKAQLARLVFDEPI
jgi:hypothetical protein